MFQRRFSTNFPAKNKTTMGRAIETIGTIGEGARRLEGLSVPMSVICLKFLAKTSIKGRRPK